MSTTLEAIKLAHKELSIQRARLDMEIDSLEDVMKDLSAGPATPTSKAVANTPRRRKPTASKKIDKVRYTASYKDITAVLEHADKPMTTFSIVEKLAEANVKVTEPALRKVLDVGERNKRFHQPEDGKWTLAQDE